MLCGETGAKLLQGPNGRHPLPEGAEGVRNSILAFDSDHRLIRFQNRAHNGGFSLEATSASSRAVTLKTPGESSKFARRLPAFFRPGDGNREERIERRTMTCNADVSAD